MLDVALIYGQYVNRIFGYFAYRIGDSAEAEDLTALTFERVVRHAGRYDAARAGVATWVFTIAERVLIDHYRRHARRDEEPWSDEMFGHDTMVTSDTPSEGLSPELQRAIAGLSERERQVVGLRFGGDLSGQEIAGIVGTTEGNVHQILSRALRRLRRDLDGVTPAR